MKRLIVVFLMVITTGVAMAQMMNPVHFTSEVKKMSGGEGLPTALSLPRLTW